MTNREKFGEIISSGKDRNQIFEELKLAFPNVNIVTNDKHFSIELTTHFLTQEYHHEESRTKDSMVSNIRI